METCKYGSGAGKRKPTAVKWKGVVCRAYKSPRKSGWEILKKCEPCRETGAEGGRVERL